MFWILLITLFLLALAFVIVPLWRDRNSVDSPKADQTIGIYKAQLQELIRDQQNGMISEQDAVTARLEIERRLLRLKPAEAPSENMVKSPPLLIGMISTVVLLLSTAFYINLGMPGMADFAHQKQLPKETESRAKLKTEIDKIQDHLTEKPNDKAALQKLGLYQSQLGHRAEAAKAYEDWYERDSKNINAALLYAESLIMLSDARVSPAALLVLKKAEKLEPRHPGVRHYLALAAYQAGNKRQALTIWQTLANDSAPNAPWLPQVNSWIRRAKIDLGQSPALPAIDPEKRKAIEAMSRDDQMAMIKKMVGRLQAKMDQNPENVEGWLRLAKAYMVIGQKPAALKSLTQALRYAPDEFKPQIKKQLEILAK